MLKYLTRLFSKHLQSKQLNRKDNTKAFAFILHDTQLLLVCVLLLNPWALEKMGDVPYPSSECCCFTINLPKSQCKHPCLFLWNSWLRSALQLVAKNNCNWMTESSLPIVWNTGHVYQQCFQALWSVMLKSYKDFWNHSKIEGLHH